MRMVDMIVKKRQGGVHTREEIEFMIGQYVAGGIPDYQMSAWLMAICWRGMEPEEVSSLTLAMMNSGDVADLGDLPGVKVDKHSTGGVGDTTTLVIAPLVAACGGTVAKMSGRGLGHTGGTLDKLESVPGVCIERSMAEFKDIVRRIGLCVVGQSGNMVPADKLLYALRDVTGTVESIPLIASSVMSKKLASGADAIVLDVKAGSGAFMKTVEEATGLARTMVNIGNMLGRRTIALITDMDQPLGMAVGNGLEVIEAIDMLSGRIPDSDPLYQICMLLAANMLLASGVTSSEEQAEEMLRQALYSGAGLKKLQLMLEALGALDAAACIADPATLCRDARQVPLSIGKSGYIQSMHAASIGNAAMLLGAGRARKEDVTDPAVGIKMHKRTGDYVNGTEAFATLYVRDESRLQEAADMLRSAVTIGPGRPKNSPMVYGIIK